jgi:hypothetical protein
MHAITTRQLIRLSEYDAKNGCYVSKEVTQDEFETSLGGSSDNSRTATY